MTRRTSGRACVGAAVVEGPYPVQWTGVQAVVTLPEHLDGANAGQAARSAWPSGTSRAPRRSGHASWTSPARWAPLACRRPRSGGCAATDPGRETHRATTRSPPRETAAGWTWSCMTGTSRRPAPSTGCIGGCGCSGRCHAAPLCRWTALSRAHAAAARPDPGRSRSLHVGLRAPRGEAAGPAARPAPVAAALAAASASLARKRRLAERARGDVW